MEYPEAEALLAERGFKDGDFEITFKEKAPLAGIAYRCELKNMLLLAPGKPVGHGFTAIEAAKNALGCGVMIPK